MSNGVLDIDLDTNKTLNQLEGLSGLSVNEKGVAILLVENTKSYFIALKSDIKALEKGMDIKFDAVNQRIDGLEKEMVGLEKRMDTRIDSLEKRMDAKIDGLEKRMDIKFAAVDKQFEAVDKQFVGLEKQMNTRFESIEVKIDKYNRTLAIFVPIAAIVLPIIVNKLMAYFGL
ncbi:hypothetical protein [Borrelia sp. P9F1]|uniref:hypothetical protein n=1 Tax=Borrelia sp. P9F1 TaxID=3058374 RepID=UPI0026485980|nr:hypothetical protein [Borrelia sp. P9F1]WKC58614.1 hypothetical protein QYZ68_05280 [Borrelia sp. P9F1]